MDVSWVYMTCGSTDEAKSIARTLIEERYAACCNILGEMTSVFWWDGGAQEETEVALIAKTQSGLVGRLTERVKAIHSYDCPCVVALPIETGNYEFLRWIRDETTTRPDRAGR